MSTQGKTGAHRNSMIWAVGGGKGGIGKSFISSSLGICVARLGKSVALVDLDLGSANLHTCLGMKSPQKTLSDYISGRTPDFNDLAESTGIAGLSLITGSNDSLDVASTSMETTGKIIRAIQELAYDVIILDLGAGTTEHTLDFFLSADQKIVAVTPEPTSVENAYRFMKASFYRKLRSVENELGLQQVIASAMDSRSANAIRSPADLIRHVNQIDPANGAKLMEKISDFNLSLLLNQVRTRQDVDMGFAIKSVCKKYFGMETEFLGCIDHDNAVWQSLRKKRPPLIELPYGTLVGQFLGVSKHLLHPQSLKAVV
jgi:flagellar biosynthesis protein FlhG